MYDVVTLRRALKKLPAGYKVKPNAMGRLSVYTSYGRYRGYVNMRHGTFEPHQHMLMPKKRKRLLRLLLALLASCAVLLLQGCSYAHYKSDKVEVYGLEFGTTRALEGLRYAKGDAVLEIDSANRDSTKGLSLIIEGAVKGAVAGVIP